MMKKETDKVGLNEDARDKKWREGECHHGESQ